MFGTIRTSVFMFFLLPFFGRSGSVPIDFDDLPTSEFAISFSTSILFTCERVSTSNVILSNITESTYHQHTRFHETTPHATLLYIYLLFLHTFTVLHISSRRIW